ncbi:MAG: ATP-binding protein [Panacibacter sp.]
MHKKLKILHLEDVKSDAEFVDKELRKGNIEFEKILVDTKTDFINALKDFAPDIILSDHSLPSFNSSEALEIVKNNGIKIPFILITATVSEEFAVSMMKGGAWDYILKDRLQRLPAAVMNALEKFNLDTQRQNFLEEVVASESLFKQAERVAHFGTWHINKLTGQTKWSEETFRILGYEPGEVIPSYENFLKNIFPEDIPAVEETIQNATHDSVSPGMYFRVKDKKKIKRYVRSQFVIEQNEQGEATGIMGFNHDITETKFAEELLYKSEANLRTIFNNTDTAYILLDSEFNIVSYNTSAEIFSKEQFGQQLTEGRLDANFFPGEQKISILDMMERVMKGEMISYELNYAQGDGSVKWYHARWFNITNNENKNFGLIVAISEITERKMAEIEREKITSDLIHRNKDLEQFTYIVSHNLRAPLANILGLSDAFKSLGENASAEDKNQFITMLDVSSKKLDNVIRDLNNILQVKQQLNEKIEKVSFAELIENIKYSLGVMAQKEHAVFNCNFKEIKHIYSRKSYLYSIFFNLISNSIKYKQPACPALIEIKSGKYQDYIQLQFSDNGLGINLEQKKDQVFGLYKRFHNHIEGKGMGLFMVKTQVEALGGTITIESEVNKGTIFTILLPA